MKREYADFRRAGYTANQSLYMAKAVADFNELGDEKVKLCAEPEYENYFDVYGEPDGYTDTHGRFHSPEQERKEIEEQIERDGCYCVVAHYWDEQNSKWTAADSVGMCAGYKDVLSPIENGYVPDLMRSAVQHYNAQFEPAI